MIRSVLRAKELESTSGTSVKFGKATAAVALPPIIININSFSYADSHDRAAKREERAVLFERGAALIVEVIPDKLSVSLTKKNDDWTLSIKGFDEKCDLHDFRNLLDLLNRLNDLEKSGYKHKHLGAAPVSVPPVLNNTFDENVRSSGDLPQASIDNFAKELRSATGNESQIKFNIEPYNHRTKEESLINPFALAVVVGVLEFIPREIPKLFGMRQEYRSLNDCYIRTAGNVQTHGCMSAHNGFSMSYFHDGFTTHQAVDLLKAGAGNLIPLRSSLEIAKAIGNFLLEDTEDTKKLTSLAAEFNRAFFDTPITTENEYVATLRAIFPMRLFEKPPTDAVTSNISFLISMWQLMGFLPENADMKAVLGVLSSNNS